MRACFLLVAAAAWAQDNRGFVNERLVARNFVKNSLKAKAPVTTPPESPFRCAIPLLRVVPSKDVDAKMVIAPPKDSGDEKMILPTIPVCPAK